jgi:hypothetical protein
MPLDLPGFYFDVARNRYFPTNSQLPRSNHHGAGSGPVPKVPSALSTVVTPDEARRDLTKPSKERNTKIQRDVMNSLGSVERFDTLQSVISNNVERQNMNLTYYLRHSKLQASKVGRMIVKCSSMAPYDSLGIDLTSLAVCILYGDFRGHL